MEDLAKIMNPMTSTFFWQVVSFVLLFVLLTRFVFKPVSNLIKKREEKIKSSIVEAEKAREEAQKLLSEYRMRLDEAGQEARRIIDENRQAAERLRAEILERANQEAARVIENARAEIEREKEKALKEIRKEAIELAILAAEKVIGKSLTDEEHLRLVEQSLKEAEEVTEAS